MEIILYVLCSSVPNHLIVFFQFWDYSWRSKKLAIALALLCLIAKVPLISWAVGAGHSVRLVEFVFSLFAAGIYFVMIRTDVFKLVLTYVLSVDYLIVARGVASFIAARYLGVNALSWQCSLLCILVYLLTLPVTMYFFRRGAQTVRDTDAPGLWRVIWLLPALTSVVVITFTSAFDPNSVSSWTSLAARLSLLVCVIVVSYVLIQSLDGLRRSAAMEEKARQMENILNLQRSQYAKLQAHMEEVRQASHDLRQHRNIINSYLESGDETRLREYLSAHADKGAADTFRCYCRNYSVNMLLNHYAERLREQGTDYEFSFDLPEQLAVSEPDLCVVLGNLLENALEACSGREGAYVRAAAKLTGASALAIVVDNSAPEAPKPAPGGGLYSTKHSGEGIGTSSVRQIALQYRGRADFSWSEGSFRASVFLNPKTE